MSRASPWPSSGELSKAVMIGFMLGLPAANGCEFRRGLRHRHGFEPAGMRRVPGRRGSARGSAAPPHQARLQTAQMVRSAIDAEDRGSRPPYEVSLPNSANRRNEALAPLSARTAKGP